MSITLTLAVDELFALSLLSSLLFDEQPANAAATHTIARTMQRIFLIHFLKTVFHAVTKGKRGEYWRTGGRMGSSGDVILRFFLRNGLFSGVE